jgi:histidinol-phosphate aminotransferase
VHGLAALRVGWGHAAAPVIDALNRIRLPFNVSTAGQAAAIAALGDDTFVAQSLALAGSGRVKLDAALRGAGLTTLPSATNFVTARAPAGPEAAQAIERELAARGILVRTLATYGMPEALRVTVGRDEEMRAFEAALAAAIAF